MAAKALTPITIANLRSRNARFEVPDGGCVGLRVLVQPSGFKSWHLRYRFRGVPRNLTLGPVLIESRKGEQFVATEAPPALDTPLTLADARALATNALRQAKSGIDPAALKRQQKSDAPGDDTVRSVGVEYLKRHAHLRSIAQREHDLELLCKGLGARPIASVKRSDLVRLQDKIEAERGPASADRVGSTWGNLAAWHASRVDDYRPPLLRGAKRNKAGARSRVLTDDEIRRVWTAAGTLSGPFGAYIKLLLLTAARRKEASGMRRRGACRRGDVGRSRRPL